MRTTFYKALSALLVIITPLFAQAQISGSSSVCVGSQITLSDLNGPQIAWLSTDNSIASVNSSGLVTGVSTGVVTISYGYLVGVSFNWDVMIVLVNATPDPGTLSYAGSSSVCQYATITLDASVNGGVWSSSDNTLATVDGSGNVTGVTGGSPTISYTVTNGICSASATAGVIVNNYGNPGNISGANSICSGYSTALTETAPGGFWYSGNPSVATVDGSGNVLGVTSGSAEIYYGVTNGCGTIVASQPFTVNASPDAGSISLVSGTTTLCPGNAAQLADAAAGGAWSSSDFTMAAVDGSGNVVADTHPGTVTISYTVTNGCGTANATFNFDILPALRAGSIEGISSLCAGATYVYERQEMSDGGGVWSSDNTSVLTVSTISGDLGNATAISAGTANLSYTVSNACGTETATQPITVGAQPGTITATPSATFCQSATVSFSMPPGADGGGWSSSNPAVAYTQAPFNQATGESGGTATITYALNSCYSTIQVTVIALPVAGSLSGTTSLSRGGAGTLVDFGANGTGAWSSCNGNYVTVDHNGNIEGLADGNTLISYTVTNVCGSSYATANVVVGSCTPSNNNIATFAGSHVYGYSGDGGQATAATMTNPFGIAADPLGNVYIADFYNNVIRMVDGSGNIHTIAGTGVAGYNGDLIPGTSAQLNGPRGLALDGNGNLYIADQYNERIRMLNLDNGTIFTVAGTGHHGGWQGYGSGNGGPATSANLDFPASVALDCGGNMYIADNGSQTVRKVDPSGIITTFAGTGAGSYNGDNILATTAMLNNPTDVKADCAGNVYIADSWNNRIRMVNSSGIITTIGGNGTPGYAGDGGPGGSAELWIPNSITLDACGDVYVCDWQNNVVRELTYTAGPGNNYYISTFAGKNANDWHGYTGDGGNADSAYMYLPAALAIDGTGNIYIADYGNNVVRFIGSTSYSSSRYNNGTTQSLTICQNDKNVAIDAKLTVPSIAGKTQSWSVSSTPTHGSVTGLNTTTTASATTVTPTGVTYTPEAGYTGTDEFTILTSDGTNAASTTITVWIDPAPNAGAIAGAKSGADGSTIALANTLGDANGVWSSSNTQIATVDANGTVTGTGNGIVTISYTVSNSCGSKSATTGIVIASQNVQPSKALLFPNPNNGSFQCEFVSETDCQLELVVSDVTGRIVYKQSIDATTGSNIVNVTLPGNIIKPSLLTVSLGNKSVKYPAVKINVTE